MDVQKEIALIKERNKRVELDKAWEMSWTRRVVIAVFTYIIASIWLVVIENEHPWLNGCNKPEKLFYSLLLYCKVKRDDNN